MASIASEQVALRRQLTRAQVLPFFERLPATVVAMEACGAGHHWARELRRLGHEVRLIAPQFAQPYVARGKNDAADAAALCEAASRPQMRFAPAHATREHDPRSWGRVWLRRRPALDGDPRRRPADRLAPGDEGAGPASPREHSTAGKARPGRITWAGDPMLRILLVVGAAAVIWQTRRGAANNPSGWLTALLERKAPKLAAVALANKMARIAGKLMASGERYAGASRAIAAA